MKQKPTDSELVILQILWSEGPLTVRSVNDRLNADSPREIGYTTTLKLMQLMLDKGLVSRNTARRTHVYAATAGEAEVQSGLLNRMADMAFRGSKVQLALRALGQADASAEELAAIKALIEAKEKEQP